MSIVWVKGEMKMARVTIKNETGCTVDLVAGLNNEFRMEANSEVRVNLKDGDIIYLDQVLDEIEEEKEG